MAFIVAGEGDGYQTVGRLAVAIGAWSWWRSTHQGGATRRARGVARIQVASQPRVRSDRGAGLSGDTFRNIESAPPTGASSLGSSATGAVAAFVSGV